MEPQEYVEEAMRLTRDRENARLSDVLSNAILVGPWEDGFAIFIRGRRIGKWPTREKACDQGAQLGVALREVLRDCLGGKRP